MRLTCGVKNTSRLSRTSNFQPYAGDVGKQDGRERQVSDASVDDSATPIMHVDMDAFFASVAELNDPSLRGKPVIIAEDDTRTVVSAANYEARKFGVNSAMPLVVAKRKCPNAVIVSHDRESYDRYSRQVMNILREFTPLVEPLSVDEAFLDVSGSRKLWGRPFQIATLIRSRILEQTGLVASVGVAANKFVAKVASGQSKPDGLLVVPASQTLEFLRPLPISVLWGVGAVAAETLSRYALHTVADVADTPVASLKSYLGDATAQRLWQLANGIDDRAVQPSRTELSVGKEATFRADVTERDVLQRVLLSHSEDVARRLRSHGMQARTIAIKLRRPDFTTLTRSVTLPEATDVAKRIYQTALELVDRVWSDGEPVRLLGVRGESLQPAIGSQALWDPDHEWRDVDRAKDEVNQRYGRSALGPASLLKSDSGRTLEPPRESGETD